jgi:hypothetical protein
MKVEEYRTMSEITCPYCNAIQTNLSAVRAGQMVTCVRCQESFRSLADVGRGENIPRDLQVVPIKPLYTKPNIQVAAMVLGVMTVMAGIGLTYALMTVKDRRANDSGLKESISHKRPRQLDVPDLPPVEAVRPYNLAALRLLPGDMDVLLGIHMAEIQQNAEGKRLLNREIPGLKGSIESRVLKRMRELTGLDASDLDHLVVGGRLRDTSIIVAIRTLGPVDRDEILRRLGAHARPQAGVAKLYEFRQELLPTHSTGMIHFLDAQTMLIGWEARATDLEPGQAREPRPEILALLKDRMSPSGPVWMAGHLDKWVPALGLLLGSRGISDQEQKTLAELRTFGVWLTLDQRVTVYAALHFGKEQAAVEAKNLLGARLEDRPGVKIFGEKDWLTLQYRPEAQAK